MITWSSGQHRVVTIALPFTSPPLRSNARHHWTSRATTTQLIRSDTRVVVRALKLAPMTGPVVVTLVWTVTDRRRRDVGASSPTLKAALDGIVDAGLLPGDHSTVVAEERCRIELGDKPGVRIEIDTIEPRSAA